MKFLMFATLLTLLSMQGCKNQNILDTLKPGKTASLEDVRHGEFTFSCDVTRDASKMIYMKKSNHQLFRDAQDNMSKARGKWQMRPIRLTGKVFLAPNPIYLKIGESRRDASGVLSTSRFQNPILQIGDVGNRTIGVSIDKKVVLCYNFYIV